VSSRIEWYIESAEHEVQRALLWQAHDLITSTIPQCVSGIKWKVPFYTYIKHLCYLNCYKDHIYVSFLQGQLLDARPQLVKHGTTQVAKYYVTNEKSLLESAFLEILLESVALQESLYDHRGL